MALELAGISGAQESLENALVVHALILEERLVLDDLAPERGCYPWPFEQNLVGRWLSSSRAPALTLARRAERRLVLNEVPVVAGDDDGSSRILRGGEHLA